MDSSETNVLPSAFLICPDPEQAGNLMNLILQAGYSGSGCGDVAEVAANLSAIQADIVVIELPSEAPVRYLDIGERLASEKEIPVVYVAGEAGEEWLDPAIAGGGAGFVVKPFELRQFQAVLRVAHGRAGFPVGGSAGQQGADIVVRLNGDREVIFAGRRFSERFLRPGETAVGRSFEEWIHKEDRRLVPAPGERGPSFILKPQFDVRCLTIGGWRWFRWNAAIRPSQSEMHLELKGFDVTRRKFREDRLGKFSQAIEQSPFAILLSDARGNVQYANRKYTEITGYTLEEILDARLKLLDTARLSRGERAELWATIASGEPWSREIRNRKKNGEPYWGSVRITPIYDNSGQQKNLLIIEEDITARRDMEEQIREAQKMENLGTLASGIAHDFNNVLAAVSGYTELALLRMESPEFVESCLNKSLHEARRAVGLVQQILSFSRASGSSLRPVDVNKVAAELVAMASETFPRTIEFSLKMGKDLPAINGDPNQIYQILLNTAVNARDAMDARGTLTIETTLLKANELPPSVPHQSSEDWICIRVTDDGCGMDEELQKKIFQPFFTTKEEGTGTGLGLAVTYGIVRNHKGRIHVESAVGKGTTFRFFFPADDPDAEAPADAEAAKRVDLDGRGMTALYVEDEESQATIMARLLERHGFHVLTASNGPSGIRTFRENAGRIQVLISDVGLPGIDGWEMYERIRESHPDLKALFVSGFLPAEIEERIHRHPNARFVHKPYQLNAVLGALRELLV